MQDAITNVINQADVQGLYLDGSAMGRLEQYFASGELRVRAAATISANGSAIIKEAATYAMLAGDTSILDERVLNGLKETYNSLGVPIGATVQSIQAMKEATAALVGPDAGREMGVYFDYISSGLGN